MTRLRLSKKTLAVIVIGLAVIIPSAPGFIDKLVQFFKLAQEEEGGGFALVPIMNYLLVAIGFICLMVWATINGMFRQIEKPKYTMLEQEEAIDQADGLDQTGEPRHQVSI